ncbi:MAG: ATP-binding protein [Chloroflexota bacterium]
MVVVYVVIACIVLLAVGYVAYRQTTVVEQAKQTASAQDRMVVSLQDDLASRDQIIADLNEETTKLDALLFKTKEQMALADSERNTLSERVSEQDAQISQLTQQLKGYQRDSSQSKALFAAVSSIAYDHVFVLDEENTVIAHNRSSNAIFGEQNPIGEKLSDVLDAPELFDIIARAATEEETLEEQFVMEGRYYRARTQVMHHENFRYFVGVAVQDITQLVRLNRARRDMVANISHELRTPITKIRFVIDSLFHDQNRPKRKASISSLREISREVGELEDVVQELLDLSMIESGQAIMKLVDEPLIEIANAAVERLDEKLSRKNITVVRHIPDKMRVLCDREHIRRVITNLISNAIKWSPEDDVITISVTSGGEDVTVSVFDNGPGVPDDQRQRIFERFYQVDTARSGKEGSGLGLAICKHIIEAHGGRIWAEGNSQGSGGRFMFTLLNPNPSEDVYMDKGQHDFLG